MNVTENTDIEIEKAIDKEKIPDALWFYPPIYYLHIIAILASLGISATISYSTGSFISFGATVVSLGVSIMLAIFASKWCPNKMRGLIEEKRAI